MTKRQKFFSAAGQFLKNVFTKNILLKVVALVFALLLWGYVLSEQKPKYVKRVTDVKIELQNENRLTQNEWEVVSIEPSTVDVSVEAGIDMHSALTNKTVKCTVNLGQISTTAQDSDTKTILLDIVATTPEGTVKKISSDQVEVTIERITSGRSMTATVFMDGSLPAIVKTNDTLPEYFECVPIDPITVEPMRGLKSDIDRIASAEVTINLSAFDNDDLSRIPGIHSRIVDVIFRDADGNIIDSSATSDVKATVDGIEIRRYKEIPIRLRTAVDESFDEDAYRFECLFADGAPQVVRIYGDAAELAKMTEIYTDTISPNPEEGKTRLTVGLIVPDGVKVNLEQRTTTVNMTVTKRETSGTAFDLPIRYSDPDENMLVTEKPETIAIKVSGLKEAMDVFDPSLLTASVDLHHYGEGQQNVPFTLQYKETDLHVQNYVIEEPADGSEPVIRITFVTKDGAAYLIELQQNTVPVTLQAIATEEPEG